jgi:hypothetical protein
LEVEHRRNLFECRLGIRTEQTRGFVGSGSALLDQHVTKLAQSLDVNISHLDLRSCSAENRYKTGLGQPNPAKLCLRQDRAGPLDPSVGAVYLSRADDGLRSEAKHLPGELPAHFAQVGWAHISFDGDCF